MRYGGQSNVAPLRRVLLKSPRVAHGSQAAVDAQWQALHYPSRPDYNVVLQQFDGFVSVLEQHGTKLVYLPASADTGLDSIYTHDPILVVDRGAILCRMGKVLRRGEPSAAAAHLASLGVPLLGTIEPPGTLEGGDLFWITPRIVAVADGYRTNAEGIRQLRALLGDSVDEVVPVPLPHWTGPADCLHLMSMVSPIADDLFLVYSRMMPVPFRNLLLERGIQLVEVPDEEYDSFACNVLATAPRRAIMLDGNPITRHRLEAAGCEVTVFAGSDLCLKGGGGPTCLTRPLLRG